MRLTDEISQHYRNVHDLDVRRNGDDRTLAESVDWGIRTKRLQMSKEQAFEFHLARMSSAMTTDVTESGARRRCCLSIKGESGNGKMVQRVLWKMVHEAPRQFLIAAFEERREGARKHVLAVKRDLEYANACLRERNETEIQLDLDHLADDGALGEVG